MESASYLDGTTSTTTYNTSVIMYDLDTTDGITNNSQRTTTSYDTSGNQQSAFQPSLPLSFGDSTPVTSISLKLEAIKTNARERYRKRKNSETVEQREERNAKRRKKYMEKRAYESAEHQDNRKKIRWENQAKQNVTMENSHGVLDNVAKKAKDKCNERRREKYREKKLQSGLCLLIFILIVAFFIFKNHEFHLHSTCYFSENTTPSVDCDASKLIVRPLLKFAALPPLSKRMRTKINGIKEKFVAYTIEFQKRGLPHAHIIIWLEESDKCHSTDEIDQLICAEIPDKETDPVGYEAISKYMIHGPCGSYNRNCACMQDDQSTKFYPKEFRSETTIDTNGYPVYRRRDNKRTIQLKEIEIDNKY